jgi:hypothetical protein
MSSRQRQTPLLLRLPLPIDRAAKTAQDTQVQAMKPNAKVNQPLGFPIS